MLKAVDDTKDQSYFLFATTKEQLNFIEFPLGINKRRNSCASTRLGLEIANKPDSQDICFVPDGDYAKVIKNYRPTAFKKGDFIHIKLKKI